jgi:hypothetical protein
LIFLHYCVEVTVEESTRTVGPKMWCFGVGASLRVKMRVNYPEHLQQRRRLLLFPYMV